MFDTNALIAFFKGNEALEKFRLRDNKILLSVITILEFLSFKNLSENDRDLLFNFLNETEIINLVSDNLQLIQGINSIRSEYNLKLPDAIIAASANLHNAVLVTSDLHFKKITQLQTQQF